MSTARLSGTLGRSGMAMVENCSDLCIFYSEKKMAVKCRVGDTEMLELFMSRIYKNCGMFVARPLASGKKVGYGRVATTGSASPVE